MKKSLFRVLAMALAALLLLPAVGAFGVALPAPVAAVAPALVPFTTTPMVAAGSSYSLALRADGTVWAWGRNESGQLGNAWHVTAHHLPSQVLAGTIGETTPLTNITTVAAGNTHSLALRADGTVWEWGFNPTGNNHRFTAREVQGLNNVIAIAAGSAYSLALRVDGTVWAWGNNAQGQLGINTITFRHAPTQVLAGAADGTYLTDIIAISAGGDHNLALRADGTTWAWGRNTEGQLGDGTTIERRSPVQVVAGAAAGTYLTNIIAMSAGSERTLALRADGTVWAWGCNSDSLLGDGTIVAQRNTPVQVVAGTTDGTHLTDIIAVSMGNHHSLALRADGTISAWGRNIGGLIGDGTTTLRCMPVQVENLSNVTVISNGHSHSLALRADGTIWSWGQNHMGHLGDGTWIERHTPVQVLGPNGVGHFDVFYGIETNLIHTPQDLDNVRHNLSGDFVVMNDIDLGVMGDWQPIGTVAAPFTGTLDGNGFAIQNMTVRATTADGADMGLFGVMENAEVRDLEFTNAVVHVNRNTVQTAGILAGHASGVIDNVTTRGNIQATAAAAGVNIGGMVGFLAAPAEIHNSTNHAAVTAGTTAAPLGFTGNIGGVVGRAENLPSFIHVANFGNVVYTSSNLGAAGTATVYVGGIAGQLHAIVNHAENHGAVTVATTANTSTARGARPRAGGIAGRSTNSIISNATNTASIRGAGQFANPMVGGIVGQALDVFILRAINTGDIHSSVGPDVQTGDESLGANSGGIIGIAAGGRIAESWNSGTISAGGSHFFDRLRLRFSMAGGMVGHVISGPFVVRNSWNSGTVSATGPSTTQGNARAGGIIGVSAAANVAIEQSYNYATVTATAGQSAMHGGIIGRAANTPSLTNVYFLSGGQASGSGGIAQTNVATLTAAEMLQQESFVGFNFSMFWMMLPDMTPQLRHGATTTFTVSFNANGGEDAPLAQAKTFDLPLRVSTQVPTRHAHTFMGWATTPNATVATVQPGDIFTLNANRTFYAVWSAVPTFAVTVANAEGSGSFVPGDTVTITATPANENERFVRWNFISPASVTFTQGNANSQTASFTMPAQAVTVTAVFESIISLLTVQNGSGSGNFAAGNTVNITANTPPTGQRFSHWNIDPTVEFANFTSRYDAAASFVMPPQATTATAVFAQLYAVAVIGGTGGGNFAAGEIAILQASTAPSGQRFSHWNFTPTVAFSGGTNATQAAVNIVVPAGGATATAVFVPIVNAVTVNNGTGGGDFAANALVNIQANTASAGQRFHAWQFSPAVTLTNGTINSASVTFVMPEAAVVATALYEAVHTVTVNGGSGDGVFAAGEIVSISANSAAQGQQFSQWSFSPIVQFVDGTSATSAFVRFVMPAGPVSATAMFEASAATLFAVTVNGGLGSASYASGATATIAANTPPAGQHFVRWNVSPTVTFTGGTNATSAVAQFTMPAQAVTATAVFEVIPVTSVTIGGAATHNLNVDGTVQLSATVAPATANQNVSWVSSNTTVATVNNAGLVTARAAGTTTITVTTADGDHTASVTVTVTQPVTGVTIAGAATRNLTTGQTAQLTATVAPTNATNRNVTWSSSNTAIATVSTVGLVTARAAGTATITVTTADGNHTAFVTVNVAAPIVAVTGVTIAGAATRNLTAGQTLQLTATAAPTNATNRNITWTSSNNSVAVVSATGLVAAVAPGTAVITASTQCGRSAQVTVTVVEPPPPDSGTNLTWLWILLTALASIAATAAAMFMFLG